MTPGPLPGPSADQPEPAAVLPGHVAPEPSAPAALPPHRVCRRADAGGGVFDPDADGGQSAPKKLMPRENERGLNTQP